MNNTTTHELHSIGPAILHDVYNAAESLYLMWGGSIPEGGTFARSADDLSERCYQAASIAYLKSTESRTEG